MLLQEKQKSVTGWCDAAQCKAELLLAPQSCLFSNNGKPWSVVFLLYNNKLKRITEWHIIVFFLSGWPLTFFTFCIATTFKITTNWSNTLSYNTNIILKKIIRNSKIRIKPMIYSITGKKKIQIFRYGEKQWKLFFPALNCQSWFKWPVFSTRATKTKTHHFTYYN